VNAGGQYSRPGRIQCQLATHTIVLMLMLLDPMNERKRTIVLMLMLLDPMNE
jgi:hypothetical protein